MKKVGREIAIGIVIVVILATVAATLLLTVVTTIFDAEPIEGRLSSIQDLNHAPELSQSLPLTGEIIYRFEPGYKANRLTFATQELDVTAFLAWCERREFLVRPATEGDLTNVIDRLGPLGVGLRWSDDVKVTGGVVNGVPFDAGFNNDGSLLVVTSVY